jgi:5,10-methylenetetrahydrofolate reductase
MLSGLQNKNVTLFLFDSPQWNEAKWANKFARSQKQIEIFISYLPTAYLRNLMMMSE